MCDLLEVRGKTSESSSNPEEYPMRSIMRVGKPQQHKMIKQLRVNVKSNTAKPAWNLLNPFRSFRSGSQVN